MDNFILKEIMRDYDRLQTDAKRLFDARQAEIYDKFHRIREIDNIISQTGFEITKNIISSKKSNEERQELINVLKERNEKLTEEKNEILRINKYPNDYLTNIYRCKKCSDTGFIESEKCSCLQQRLIDKYCAMSNLKDTLEYENFHNFDYRHYSEEKADGESKSPYDRIQDIYSTAQQFVDDFDKEPTNLLFYGRAGAGKTFMCNCIAKDLLEKGKTVLYLTATQLFKAVTEYRFNKNDDDGINNQQLINFVYTVDLLIIDDLGTEFLTLITTTELFNFINERLLGRLHTIISTNLDLKNLTTTYSDRVTSRIIGNYVVCNFPSTDIRFKKKYPNAKL